MPKYLVGFNSFEWKPDGSSTFAKLLDVKDPGAHLETDDGTETNFKLASGETFESIQTDGDSRITFDKVDLADDQLKDFMGATDIAESDLPSGAASGVAGDTMSFTQYGSLRMTAKSNPKRVCEIARVRLTCKLTNGVENQESMQVSGNALILKPTDGSKTWRFYDLT